jgi:hypothetical protein
MVPLLWNGGFQNRGGYGQVTDAFAGGFRDCVYDSGGGRSLCGFACAEGMLFGAVDDLYFESWRLIDMQDGVGAPLAAGDVLFIEFYLLEKGPAGGLHHAAFDLIYYTVEVDDLTCVDDGP